MRDVRMSAATRVARRLLSLPESVLGRLASRQRIVRDGRVAALDGTLVPVRADTICVHGDTPGAVEYVAAVRAALGRAGVTISAMGR